MNDSIDILYAVFNIAVSLMIVFLILSACLFFRLRIADIVMELTGRRRAGEIRKMNDYYLKTADEETMLLGDISE